MASAELASLACSFPDNLPELSPNSFSLLANAVKCVRERRHSALGTEHVLFALLQTSCAPGSEPSRAATWIAQCVGRTIEQVLVLAEAELEDRPLWAVGHQPSPSTLPLTPCLRDSLHLLSQFASQPIHDPRTGTVYSAGLVATEFLVAGILVEGTSVAADILQRISRGKANSAAALKIINVDGSHLKRDQSDRPWESDTWVRGTGMDSARSSWLPELNKSLPKIKSLPGSPSSTSNWLIPGRLLIGAKPGGYYRDPDEDVQKYLEVGVTTFVCLIGEYRSLDNYLKSYPAVAKRQAEETASCSTLDFLHFPIRDFEVTAQQDLQLLVLELKRRLLQGEVVFLHCLGGHGRTGMVVIPLIMALYSVDYTLAEAYVNDSTQRHRKADRGFRHEMPETHEQAQVAEASDSYVKKHKR